MTADGALAQLAAAEKALAERAAGPFPLPLGDLAPVVAGTLSALEAGDWWLPSLRERVGAVLRGVPVERLLDPRSGALPYKVVPPGGSPALRALLAVGIAHAERVRPERWTAVHLGIGSCADGAFHEALNLAALLRPNVLFLVSVHPLEPRDGEAAPLGPQLGTSPAALARSYEIDAVALEDADPAGVAMAVRAAREEPGPHLVEVSLRAQEDAGTRSVPGSDEEEP